MIKEIIVSSLSVIYKGKFSFAFDAMSFMNNI